MSEREDSNGQKNAFRKGLSAAEVEIIGKGEQEPIARNSTEGQAAQSKSHVSSVREISINSAARRRLKIRRERVFPAAGVLGQDKG
ncbi:MAG: hypothetical protein IPL65_09630 [Lewinellaceae bacterium]|nr:hypothetical protein [Lewinellaceae bacterium]